MLAARHGTVDALRALVAKGANLNAKDKFGSAALHMAIAEKQRAAALFLINDVLGVDINTLDRTNRTALMLAAGVGDVAVMKALVAKGANVNAKNERGLTPLHVAICRDQEEAALYLVEEEAAVAVYDPNKPGLALNLAISSSQCRVMRAIVRRMRADGMDSATVAAEMGMAAIWAIGRKIEGSLEALSEEGLDVDHAPLIGQKGGSYGHQLFHDACLKGNREAADLLLERGCDPLARNGRGERAHHVVAAREGGLPMLKWLMASFPIPVDERVAAPEGVSGGTMLHFAAGCGRLETVQWLVGAGADVLCTAQGFWKVTKRPSEVAEMTRQATVAAYLREAEAEAEAALEAAARRARNEKRRQKQKNAKARRRAAAGGEDERAGAEEDEDEDEDEALLDAALAELGVAGGASGGQRLAPAGGQEEEQQQQQAAAAEDEDEDDMLAAAIALSLAPAEEQPPPPPPLAEFLEARTPQSLLCPITLQLLEDPVVLVADGCTYSRAAIERHLAFCREKAKPLASPSTNLEMDPAMVILAPNVHARGQVLEFKAAATREWEALRRRWEEEVGGDDK